MAAFPINPQPGAQMGTVPGGGGSQNLNPMGSSQIGSPNISPITATLPVSGQATSTANMVPGLMTPTNTYGTVPTAAAPAAGGYDPATGVSNPNASTQEAGSKTLLGDLQSIYGQGTGTAVGNVLGNLGTTTSTAAEQMIGPAMQAAQSGWSNIQTGMGARGVSADSSTAGLAAGDYWGQVSQGISSELGQIGLHEEDTLINALTGAGTAHGGDQSGWDTFGSVMSGIGNAAVKLGSSALSGGIPLSGIWG